jgi:hypothetical protein
MSKSGAGTAMFGVGESSIEYMHILWYSSSRFTLLAIDLNHLVISSLSVTTWFNLYLIPHLITIHIPFELLTNNTSSPCRTAHGAAGEDPVVRSELCRAGSYVSPSYSHVECVWFEN